MITEDKVQEKLESIREQLPRHGTVPKKLSALIKRVVEDAKKLPKNIIDVLEEKLILFQENPFNPALNNHALKGSMRDYRSINITGNYRLIYEFRDDDIVRLINIGTHSELYGK